MKIFKPKDQPMRKAAAEMKKKKVPKAVKIIILIIIIVGLGYLILWQTGYLNALKLAVQIQKQQQLSADDAKILNQLKKIILLPDDVTPTMAVITDIDALKENQPDFFANAKNDDHLILYPTMAIIYDAEANKIIKVGPVQVAQAQPVNFAIYNSTSDDNKTKQMEEILKNNFNNAAVVVEEKAAKIDYPQTLVIDLVGNNPEIQQIADAVGGVVSSLPDGETAPENAAVLIIIGKQ